MLQRVTTSEAILFPVQERPVFATIEISGQERRLPVPDKKALVNVKTGRVLSIVSRGYRLVTNQQALDWAYQCCRTAFPETKPGEWRLSTVDGPATATRCCIDLVHSSTALDFTLVDAKDRPEAYGPFIRVTNSYNGARALAFDIGFHRKICKNGLIVPDTIIRFKFSHVRDELGAAPEFDIQPERIAKLKSRFAGYVDVLRILPVARIDFEPLVRVALSIKPAPSQIRSKSEGDDYAALDRHLADVSERYASELGENAYAVFNAVTDFASNPPQVNFLRRERQSFQRLAGAWLVDFAQDCRKANFTIAGYISKKIKDRRDFGIAISQPARARSAPVPA